jgi:hypothetical protein
MEGDGAAVLRHFNGLGDQAVEAERLVAATRHQALVHVLAQTGGSDTFDDEGVQAVEGAERAEHDAAVLRCVRIDVGKVREARSMLGRAMHRQPLDRLGSCD